MANIAIPSSRRRHRVTLRWPTAKSTYPWRLATALLVTAPLLFVSARGSDSLDSRLGAIAGSHSFNLWQWEVRTLTARAAGSVLDPTPTNAVDKVNEYIK